MKLCQYVFLAFAFIFTNSSIGQPEWSKNTPYPVEGRPNPFDLPADQLPSLVRSGKLHALNYPVKATGILLPYEPIKRISDSNDRAFFESF